MSLKIYGIYLVFPPSVQLNCEGLGRYIISFLKAQHSNNVRFLIACPSWFNEDFTRLCESEGLSRDSFDLISPTKKPIILHLYTLVLKIRKKKVFSNKYNSWIKQYFIRTMYLHFSYVAKKLVTTRNIIIFLCVLVYATILGFMALPVFLLKKTKTFLHFIKNNTKRVLNFLKKNERFSMHYESINEQIKIPQLKNTFVATYLYRLLEESEIDLLINKINKLTHVKAWYCPTSFWPSFNRIKAPRLLCVPDIVINQFPLEYANISGVRTLLNYKDVVTTVLSGENYVTYSEHIKNATLIDRYTIDPDNINVIPHAPSTLNTWITVQLSDAKKLVSSELSKSLLSSAFLKSSNYRYTKSFMNTSVKFLFYASQIRPSKNVISLLHAYNHLLKKRYIGHKLILTGNINTMPQIKKFIYDNNLANDVLFLHGITTPELAACYKLADLAVNPSLSEGGCPFTLTEALSVNTPVVMANIPVTLEVVKDEDLRSIMLFDPYDWKDMANRIEWALQNRDLLLERQLVLYAELAKRTWSDVVKEHITILDKISSEPCHISNFSDVNKHQRTPTAQAI